MKMDRKAKAEHNPANLNTNHSKSVGKETDQTFTRAQTAEGQLPSFDERTQRAQEEAIGSRQRLLATYEHAPIGIIENSPEGDYVNCNEEFCRITGYEKEELLSLTIKGLTYEEDYIFDIKLHQRLVAGDIPFYKLEKRYIRKDGEIIWAEVTRSLVRDTDGKPLYTIGAVLDVSERKRAEEALRDSEEKYRTLFASIDEGFCIIEKVGGSAGEPLDFRYIAANPAFAAQSGVGDVVGKTIRQAFPGEPEEWFETYDAILRSGEAIRFERDLVTQGRVLELYAFRVEDETYRRVAVIFKDITARRQAENRLTLLTEISDFTRKFEDPNELLFAISKAIGEHLQVRRCLFNEIDLKNDRETVHRDYCRGVESVADVHKISDYSSITSDEMRAGKTVVNYDSKIDARTAQDYERIYVPNGERAYVAVPMVRENRWVASLWVSDDTPRAWSKEEVSLLETVAERTWTAIEKLRIDTALRASEERYRNLFDLVPVAAYACDADGLIQEYNHRAVELWGREPLKNNPNERFCGSLKIFHPDGRFMPHEKCPMARMLAGETLEPYELEILVERPDGVRRNVLAHPLAVKNERGEIIGAINCLYDITERKQAEDALQQLNLQLESRVQSRTQRLNEVIEVLREEISERKRAEGQLVYQAQLIANVNDAILATDENLAISYWNQTAEQIYGWKAEEVMGRSATEFLQSEFMDGNTRSEALQKVKETGELRTAVTHLRKDGTRIFIDAHTSILHNADARTVGYISINRDVTERAQAEEALHKSRESLRKLSKRLVEVQEDERRAIARELHDRVGQTLAALNINLMIMNGQLLEDSKQRIGSRLDDSMHLVAEAIALVRNVMTDLRPAVLDDYGLEAALQSYIDEYQSRYDIKVLLDPADQPLLRLGPSVEMTLLRIAQEALTNVARHAQARQVNVSLQLADHSVYLTVQDDGVGMESWQSANQPGSHGMRIMRERAEAFGGILNVGSTPGNGTKVEARIPIGSGGQHKVQEEKG
jgi:PAS domain S-box-containing protein